MQDQDSELATLCRTLADNARHAVDWLRDNSETVGAESPALQKNMRRAARFFGKCEQAARRKMCVGIFGPSQSGKSYLISALARDAKGSLLADFCGTSHDFITEINPEGGKESTGLVTRFTTTRPDGLKPEFPIRLRLLSEMDVVRVLANTYYADCEHKEAPKPEALSAALDSLEGRSLAPVQGMAVSADDVEALREYLNKNFKSRPRVQMLDQGFWVRAVNLAPKLDLAGRAELFGQIWNNLPVFQNLFLQLCGALAQLGNPTEADCPLSALIPRENSIIDVALLQNLSAPQGESLSIQGVDGRTAELPRAVVTALTAEITIYMREKPDDFFDYTDLLDFPGYRSRLKLEDLTKELERPGTLGNLFLRGKVAYLFERYCEEKELTSMLLCIGPGNQEVQDLPKAVYEWICSTHGENPANRAGRAPALFFVLSKMDMEFEKKKGTPSVESRWTTRLQSSLLDFFGKQHDWPVNWDGSRPFTNIFLLRNPNFRCEAVFSFEAERESGIRPEQQAYVERVRQAFLQSPLVQQHVAGPEEIWQAAMALNDGGVALLRQRLRPLCNPELKRRQIEVNLSEMREQVRAGLAPFHLSEDADALRRQKEQLSHTLISLLARVAERQLFGEFLRRMQVHDYQLYDIFFRARQSPEAASDAPQPQVVGTRSFATDIMGDIFGEQAGDGAPLPHKVPGQGASNKSSDMDTNDENARDTSALLAGLALEHWIARLRDMAADTEVRSRYGLPPTELEQLCHELVASARRCKVKEQLEKTLRKASSYSNIARERQVWKQVSLAADALNAFTDWLGFDPRSHDQAGRSILLGGKSVNLFTPPPEIKGEPHLAEEEAPYDRVWYTDWLRALAWSCMANLEADEGRTGNPEQNKRLHDILQAFKD